MTGVDLLGRATPVVSTPVGRVPRVKSAPARTLQRFPMDMYVSDVRQFMCEKKSAQKKAKAETKKLCAESKDLQQYGKCLFEYTVSKHTAPAIRPRPATAWGKGMTRPKGDWSGSTRPGSRGCYPDTTGPSSYGSVIYNRKAMVLNAIRTRPISVPGSNRGLTQFFDLRQTLESPRYRLRVSATPDYINCAGTSKNMTSNEHNNSFDDVFLIPEENSVISEFYPTNCSDSKDKKTVEDDDIEQNKQKTSFRKPSIPILVQIDATDSDSDSLELIPEDRLSDRRPSSRESADKSAISPKPGSAGSRGKAKARKKSPSNTREGNLKPGKSDNGRSGSPASPGGRPNSASRGKAKSRTASGSSRRGSIRGQKGVVEEPLAKTPLPGPHCWVDDVTVSSDPMGCEEGTSEPANSVTECLRRSANTNSSYVTSGKEDYVLPGFLCPSSELKSRSASTKQWLKTSVFFNSNRAVPLL